MKNYANIMSISDEYIKEDINGLSTNESMYNLKNVFNYKNTRQQYFISFSHSFNVCQ